MTTPLWNCASQAPLDLQKQTYTVVGIWPARAFNERLAEQIGPQCIRESLHHICAAIIAPLVPIPGKAPKRAALPCTMHPFVPL
jgi:hypothetical protein